MYSTAGIEKGLPLKPTKFVLLRIMCGGCKFRCCISPSLEVECTPDEQEILATPAKFPIDGGCQYLGPKGCRYGDQRPVHCKFAPLQIKMQGRGKPALLVVAHWFILNCPTTSDYELVSKDSEGYHYRIKKVGVLKAKNSHDELHLPVPIDKAFGHVLDTCSEGLDRLVGEGTAARMHKVLKPGGFGFER